MFPKVNNSKIKGVSGEIFFQYLVYDEMNCLYQKNSEENDYGIDGFIELIENDIVSGKRVAVQIKHGNSFFLSDLGTGYKFIGENRHLNYYMNCDVPVFIILLDDTFERMNWVQFKIEKTMILNEEKWWIEVPKKNNVRKNFKKAIFEAISPIIDYEETIMKDWLISDMLYDSDSVIMLITRDELENEDFSYVWSYISSVSRNKKMLIDSRNILDICFAEYNNDVREIYEIPEIVRWLKKSIDIGIPWFYFLNYKFENAGLLLLLEVFCCDEKLQTNDGMYMFKIDNEKYKEFLEINFCNLNDFMEKNEICMDVNYEISEGIVSYYEHKFN